MPASRARLQRRRAGSALGGRQADRIDRRPDGAAGEDRDAVDAQVEPVRRRVVIAGAGASARKPTRPASIATSPASRDDQQAHGVQRRLAVRVRPPAGDAGDLELARGTDRLAVARQLRAAPRAVPTAAQLDLDRASARGRRARRSAHVDREHAAVAVEARAQAGARRRPALAGARARPAATGRPAAGPGAKPGVRPSSVGAEEAQVLLGRPPACASARAGGGARRAAGRARGSGSRARWLRASRRADVDRVARRTSSRVVEQRLAVEQDLGDRGDPVEAQRDLLAARRPARPRSAVRNHQSSASRSRSSAPIARRGERRGSVPGTRAGSQSSRRDRLGASGRVRRRPPSRRSSSIAACPVDSSAPPGRRVTAQPTAASSAVIASSQRLRRRGDQRLRVELAAAGEPQRERPCEPVDDPRRAPSRRPRRRRSPSSQSTCEAVISKRRADHAARWRRRSRGSAAASPVEQRRAGRASSCGAEARERVRRRAPARGGARSSSRAASRSSLAARAAARRRSARARCRAAGRRRRTRGPSRKTPAVVLAVELVVGRCCGSSAAARRRGRSPRRSTEVLTCSVR